MGIEYLYLVGLALMGGCCTFFRKRYTQVTSGSSLTGSLFYIMAVGIISLFSYWAMAGGTIHTDSRTLIYSVASSFVYVAVNVISLFSYQKVNLVLLAIFNKSLTIINWLMGILIFNETPTVNNVISVVILLIAVFMPLIDLKDNKKNLKTTYLIGGTLLILNTLNSLLSKTYLMHPSVDSSHMSSMLFFTNGLMIFPPIFIMLFRRKRHPEEFKQECSHIRWPAIACIVLACCFGNPGQLLSSMLMKVIPLVQFSILTSALNSIVLLLVSKFLFKEKLGKSTIIAFVMSTIAIIINGL